VDAEVLEFSVHEGAKITAQYLKNLKFPKDALISGVVRKDKAIIPNGDFRIRKNDKVVVLCTKNTVHEVEEYFK
jgi:trk system potassium uptake protein TrkA